MPVTKKCTIKGCLTYATMGIPMHRFPQKEELLLKWLDALKEANITEISVHTVIYGLHFKLSEEEEAGANANVTQDNTTEISEE